MVKACHNLTILLSHYLQWKKIAKRVVHLLRKFLFLQPDSKHVGKGSPALLVKDIIHERRALGQDLEAQRDAVHIIIGDGFLR